MSIQNLVDVLIHNARWVSKARLHRGRSSTYTVATMMSIGIRSRRNIPVNVPNVLLFAVKISIRDICAAAEAASADTIARVEKCILN